MRGREVVWRWSHGRAFTMALEQITLKPGESRTFEAVWEQKDNAGKDVPEVDYGSRASSRPSRDTRGSSKSGSARPARGRTAAPAAGAPAIPGRQPGTALRGKPLRGMALVAAGCPEPLLPTRKHACWYDVSKRLLSVRGLWVLKAPAADGGGATGEDLMQPWRSSPSEASRRRPRVSWRRARGLPRRSSTATFAARRRSFAEWWSAIASQHVHQFVGRC